MVVLDVTPTKASSTSLGTEVVIWVNATVAVEVLYLLLLASIGLEVFTPIKLAMAPVAGWLVLNVQAYEAGSEAVTTL